MKMISSETEYEEIVGGNKPVVLDFYANWCGSCQMLLPILEAAGKEYGDDIVVAKIDVEEYPELVSKFSIKSIPAVFLLKNGNVVDHFTGVQTRIEIDKRIDHLISANTAEAIIKPKG